MEQIRRDDVEPLKIEGDVMSDRDLRQLITDIPKETPRAIQNLEKRLPQKYSAIARSQVQ